MIPDPISCVSDVLPLIPEISAVPKKQMMMELTEMTFNFSL